jgi:intracellular multiplication protein IcmK
MIFSWRPQMSRRMGVALLVLGVCGLGPSGAALAQTAQGQSTQSSEPGLDDPGYVAARRNAIPLTPAMIEDLKRRFIKTQQAETGDDGTSFAASPMTRDVNASLGPGGVTTIVATVPGYPTAISFLDSTGQPWPIAWDTNGLPVSGGGASAGGGAQSVSGGGATGPQMPAVDAVGLHVSVPFKGSNVLQLQPNSPLLRGGVLVTLENAPKPLAFMIVSGKGQYDADMTVRVSGRGPHAREDIITRPDTPETGAPYLTAMLDGVPPASAVPLSVEGVSPDAVRAWQMDGRDYIRTNYTLLSPEWVASEDGSDGTTIYAIPQTPVVLLSAGGRTVAAHLGGQ